MDVLLMESDQKVATEVADYLNDIFNSESVSIVTSGNLSFGVGLLMPSGMGPISLIVCAETLEEHEHPQQKSNGLEFMDDYREKGATTPVIILCDQEPKGLLVVNNMYKVHRHSRELRDHLQLAVEYFFPQVFTRRLQ